MADAKAIELAGEQHNRISRRQLHDRGLSDKAIHHRVRTGRLVIVEQGVFAFAPLNPDDEWGKWMGATLTAPNTALSICSSAAAWGFWDRPRPYETVTRPGSGGPRRHGGLRVHRSSTLINDLRTVRGIPLTSPARTLADLATQYGDKTLARSLREAIRLERTSLAEVADFLGGSRHRGRPQLARAVARYSGLPLERARSGAEVRALEILRDAGRPIPLLNVRRAGEEADLSWDNARLIVEIDGGPFHQDRGEDARKQGAWESAGWMVRRIDSDRVYDSPHQLLAIVPS